MQMSKRRASCRYAGSWLAVSFVAAAAMAAEPDVRMLHAPGVQPTARGNVLVYELNVRNGAGNACARLVDVRAEGGVGVSLLQRRYQGKAIAANALVYGYENGKIVSYRNPDDPRESIWPVDVRPGGGVIVYFFLDVAEGKPAPATLRHQLDFTACADGATARSTVAIESALSNQPPVVVGMPFRGDGWVAGDSVNPGGTHRRTVIPVRGDDGHLVEGEFHVPERYAIDWVVVDGEARRAIGPVNDNASYLAYGQQVIAVADGVISRTRDGMPEQTPPKNPPEETQTVETAAGNYIMQDIGGGHYAFYAHLQPGSLRVADGQHVTRGQVIALLGNTGNTSEPHLHFHVSDANDPLISEGVPFVFDQFQTTGQVEGMDEDTGLFEDYRHHALLPRWLQMPASYSVLTTAPAAVWPPLWAFPLGRCTP